jgi:hypothetical protein
MWKEVAMAYFNCNLPGLIEETTVDLSHGNLCADQDSSWESLNASQLQLEPCPSSVLLQKNPCYC